MKLALISTTLQTEEKKSLINKIKNIDTVAETHLSPCIKQCKLEKNVCVSCKRSIKQIKEWMDYSLEKRREIMKSLKETRL